MKDCLCCTGVARLTPATITNPQGLSTVLYRVGEHGSFFESMLAQLAGDRDFGLRTRETDDFSIALLDATAVVCDILSFYQERFANEHYLRTAKERQSLVGLAQLFGYRLAPGRAASTFFAFTLESAIVPPTPPVAGLPPGPYPNPGKVEGVPFSVLIPAGTKVQSVPGPGQKPQIFESTEDIDARPEWNSIPLRPRATYSIGAATFAQLELAGFVNALKEGDFVLLQQSSAAPVFTQVRKVDARATENKTLVTFTSSTPPSAQLPTLAAPPATTSPTDFDDSYISNAIRGHTWKQTDLETIAESSRWDTDRLETAIRTSQVTQPSDLDVIVLGASAALFGHNARTDSSGLEVLAIVKNNLTVLGNNSSAPADPKISDQNAGDYSFYLDMPTQAAVPGRWIVLDDVNQRLIGMIAEVRDISVSIFDLRSRVTKVRLESQGITPASVRAFSLQNTRVLIETTRATAALPRIELVPNYSTAQGSALLLDGPYFGLKPGKKVVVTGELASLQGQTAFEPAIISSVTLDDGYTNLTLVQSGGAPALTNQYRWETVRVLANVAEGTHGETVDETLGSGDAGIAFQRFALKQSPITFVSAAVPGGIRPALTVRVNGIAWKLVDNLFASGPQDRVYMLETASDGKTYVVFGDGANGARLPSGQENVTAHYRRGIGKEGNLDPGQLSLALSRPLGLSAVVNPVAASGGGDPESLEEARISLPFPLRSLGRIVTLQDYEDFARASAGIAKCSGHWIWDGHRWVVHVTIAGPDGQLIPPGTPAFDDLLSAMQNSGDPHVPVAMVNYRPRFFNLDATLIIHPDYVADIVLASARLRLRSSFGFVQRAFAQPVFLSEVIAVLQGTEGVTAVDLNALHFSEETPVLTSPPPEYLPAEGPTLSGSVLQGAMLLTIDNGGLPTVRVRS